MGRIYYTGNIRNRQHLLKTPRLILTAQGGSGLFSKVGKWFKGAAKKVYNTGKKIIKNPIVKKIIKDTVQTGLTPYLGPAAGIIGDQTVDMVLGGDELSGNKNFDRAVEYAATKGVSGARNDAIAYKDDVLAGRRTFKDVVADGRKTKDITSDIIQSGSGNLFIRTTKKYQDEAKKKPTGRVYNIVRPTHRGLRV